MKNFIATTPGNHNASSNTHVLGTEVSIQSGKPTSEVPNHYKECVVKRSYASSSLTGINTTPANAKSIINQFSRVPKVNCIEASSSRKHKTEDATVMTSSPFKKKLEERELMKSRSYNKKQFISKREKGKQRKKLKSNRIKNDIVDSDEEYWPCLACGK